jgi:hypothetical protein
MAETAVFQEVNHPGSEGFWLAGLYEPAVLTVIHNIGGTAGAVRRQDGAPAAHGFEKDIRKAFEPGAEHE